MSGQQAGSFIGGIIGSYFGPVGYAIGAAIGGAVGGYIDPTIIKGPRLTDATQQTAQDGIPITWGFGTYPTTGNIIWRTDLRERKKEDDGKGTGIVNVTYHYYRDYAVGICQGVRQTDGTYLPIEGILQVKKNGKIVYDVQPGASTEQAAQNTKFLRNVRFYLGSETQEPDSVLETHLGINNTPAFPGMVYMVVENEEQPDGAIPQWSFVVSVCGTTTPATDSSGQWWMVVRSDTTAQQNRLWRSHDGLTYDPPTTRVPNIGTNIITPVYAGGGRMMIINEEAAGQVELIDDPTASPLATSIVAIGASLEATYLRVCGDTIICPREGTSTNDYVYSITGGSSWGIKDGPDSHAIYGINRLASGRWLAVTQDNFFYSGDALPETDDWTTADSFPAGNPRGGITTDGSEAVTFEFDTVSWKVFTTSTGESWEINVLDFTPQAPLFGVAYIGTFVIGCENGAILRRASGVWATEYLNGSGTVAARNVIHLDIDRNTGRIVASCTDRTVWVGSIFNSNWTQATIPFSPNFDDQIRVGFFNALGSGLTPIPDAPGYYVNSEGQIIGPDGEVLDRCKPTLGEIVAEVCYRSGLTATDIDVSQLTDEVDGFKVATESTGEAIIGPLMQGWFFDAGEFDDKIRFIKRGGNVSAELTVDDLCETDGDIIEETELQEAELLRKVHIKTIDPGSSFTITTQTAERLTSTVLAKGEQTTEIAVVTDKDTQAQIAAKKLKVGWAETRRFGWFLPYTRPDLTVTDVIGITDTKGRRQRVRLMEISEDSGRIHVKEAMLDRQSSYTSNVEGATHVPSVDTAADLIGPTDFVAMNLPSLRTSDNVPGAYIAAAGFLSGWPGAVIFMSSDDGVTYQQVATFADPSTMGVLTQDCTASSEPISVFLRAGTLSSVTAEQIGNRFNGFAITTNDVSELGQFQTATLDSSGIYEITDILRGQMGTTATSHFDGDHFVMASTAQFLPLDISLSGRTLYFKAVSVGTSIDDAEIVPFVFNPLFTSITIETLTEDGDPITVDSQPIYVVTQNA